MVCKFYHDVTVLTEVIPLDDWFPGFDTNGLKGVTVCDSVTQVMFSSIF